MIYRLIMLIILAIPVAAQDGYLDYIKPGMGEKLVYENKTFRPMETNNVSYMEIRRLPGDEVRFTLNLLMDIPGQKVKIYSNEEYVGKDFRLVSSKNYFDFPKEVKEKAGTDSIWVNAVGIGDSLKIETNNRMALPGTIYYPKGAITGIGSYFKGRTRDFSKGSVYDYQFVNFLQLAGKPFKFVPAVDSVRDLVVVNTPIGSFECHKIENTIAGVKTYIYYTTDSRHIPVKLEFIDPTDNAIMMMHTITEYKLLK